MTDNPWSQLASPDSPNAVSARRADADNRWDFYWAKDRDHRCLLVLRFSGDTTSVGRLPRLKGVDVFVESPLGATKRSLVLRLMDGTLRDIFQKLCLDIMSSAAPATSEHEAVAVAVARTWRWHHLLRGGGGGLLTGEEQKGLIGELLVLEKYLMPTFSPAAALGAWRGPLDAAKDFTIGQIAIESKARGTANASEVRISSEQQLDETGLDALFLHVSVLDGVEGDHPDGLTVTDVAQRVRDRLVQADPHAGDKYDALLASAGFSFDDDYSGTKWSGGERGVYQVKDDFPRLVVGAIPSAASRVEYSLSLSTCGEYLVSPAVLEAALSRHAN